MRPNGDWPLSPRQTRLAVASIGVVVGVIVAMAISAPTDPSAQFFPTTPVPSSQPGDSTAGLTLVSQAPAQVIRGAIARPDVHVTPGAVASTDLNSVCRAPRSTGIFSPKNRLISLANQDYVFNAYHIPANKRSHYGLDFLVPLQLGGADTVANIWPMPRSHGIGFREKQTINFKIHRVVCQSQMTLQDAQQQFEHDWVKLWIQYGSS